MKLSSTLRCSAVTLAIVGSQPPLSARAGTQNETRNENAESAETAALKEAIAELRALRAEVAELQNLRTEVAKLKAQLNATQAQAATLASDVQVQTAASPAPAATRSTALAPAASPVPAGTPDVRNEGTGRAKTAWYDKITISGRTFLNVSSYRNRTDGKSRESGSGMQIKRLYLTLNYRFDPIWSVQVTADVDNVLRTVKGDNTGRGFYAKNAFIEAALDPRLIVRAGAAGMPWTPYVEGIYGRRYIEQTATDRVRVAHTADWGLHLSGKFNDGLISYAVSAVDGAGFRNPNASQTIDIEGRVSLTYKGIQAGLGGYTGRLGKNTKQVQAHHRANRLNALLAYKNDDFTLGGEFFRTWNYDQVTSRASDAGNNFSVFGSYNLNKRIALFSRYDWYEPSKKLNKDMRSNYWHFGMDMKVIDPLTMGLVYKHARTKNGSLNTSDGTIGGSEKGTFQEIGLYGQMDF